MKWFVVVDGGPVNLEVVNQFGDEHEAMRFITETMDKFSDRLAIDNFHLLRGDRYDLVPVNRVKVGSLIP